MRPEIFPLLLLAGCVSANIPAASCKTLALPPVPQDVYLNIKGNQVLSNAGGDLLLRGYVQARSLDAK